MARSGVGARAVSEGSRRRFGGEGGFAWSFGHDQVPVAGFQVFAEVLAVMTGSANAITESMTSAKLAGSRSSSSCLRRQASQRCWPMAP